MSIVMKNGNGKIKNFLSTKSNTKTTLDLKREILNDLNLNSPFFPWPNDKYGLLEIIVSNLFPEENVEENIDNKDLTNQLDNEVSEENSLEVDSNLDSQVDEVSDVNLQDNDSDNNLDSDNISENESEDDNVNSDIESSNENLLVKRDYVDENEYINLPDEIYSIEGCSEKVLGLLVRILNYRANAIRKIDKLKLSNADEDTVNYEVQKVMAYNYILSKYLPVLNQQDCMDVVNVDTAKQLFEDVCAEGYEEIPTQNNIELEIKKNKEEQDFDIVAALAYVGVNVDKDDYGYYDITKYDNSNGIKYLVGDREKNFCLSKESTKKFIDDFLNVPIEHRKFITPGQVFISYISEAERNLGINSHSSLELDNIFGTMANSKNAKSYFKDVIKKYSRNSKEWKDFKKIFYSDYYANKENKDDIFNRLHIKQQSKKLVIGDLFEEFLNSNKILSDEQLNIGDYRIGDISRDFGLDFNLEDSGIDSPKVEKFIDQAFRAFSTLHSRMQEIRLFTQDIIDNYTVDYLRKEKIFLLQQEDQNEYIAKKKEYEEMISNLSIDLSKNSVDQINYFKKELEKITQKIGDAEYKEAKNILLRSKNNYRVLLINAKTQKETIEQKINEAYEEAVSNQTLLTYEEKIDIIKECLTISPDLVITFGRGVATYWEKHKRGDSVEKNTKKLSSLDRIIEKTAIKISDESHRKILEENKIRDAVRQSKKQERVDGVNSYINAVGSLVGNASNLDSSNIFGQNGLLGGKDSNPLTNNYSKTPNFSGADLSEFRMSGVDANFAGRKLFQDSSNIADSSNEDLLAKNDDNHISYARVLHAPKNNARGIFKTSNSKLLTQDEPVINYEKNNNLTRFKQGNNSFNAGVTDSSMAQGYQNNGMQMGYGQSMQMNPMMGNMMMGMPGMYPNLDNFNMKKNYAGMDYINEDVEPCILPFICAFEKKGETIYGNALENYATFDRYKFLLITNNNALFKYIEDKKANFQTPDQIIKDLYIRYMKLAMAKSSFKTPDENLKNFDSTGNVKRYIAQFVPQNIIDNIMSDYNEIVSCTNFELLKDLIDKKITNDLEDYVPKNIKEDILKCSELIATIAKLITSDNNVKKTFEAYSNKMKQTYINSLIGKIESGEIPKLTLNSEQVYERIVDYLSFSCKGQNVIIQTADSKGSGLGTYPRSIFFKQKNFADVKLANSQTLSFEQNEIITSDNNPSLSEDNDITNIFGTLYKFNGSYNKVLLKLKPDMLKSGVKFMENLIDSLKEEINIKTETNKTDKKEKKTTYVRFTNKNKENKLSEDEWSYEYDDLKWFIRKGFIVDKIKIKEFCYLLSFGFKYALDKDKKLLKEDFYQNGILSLTKINEKFNDYPPETVELIISVIRTTMLANCERLVDLMNYLFSQFNLHINKLIYISKTIYESQIFDRKTPEEKVETLNKIENDFNVKVVDLKTPHPEIYASVQEVEAYEELYLYYAMFDLFETIKTDERMISKKLTDYYIEFKKILRNELLVKIRDKVYLNGYEVEISKYFELSQENVLTLDDKPKEVVEDLEVQRQIDRARIQNIDLIFKGILDAFNRSLQNVKSEEILADMSDVSEILNFVGELPHLNSQEKDLEISLPNKQTIICNIKGFLQQYLFRYIIDGEDGLGPFSYVVSELVQHEEYVDIVKNIEIVSKKLNTPELGINLFAGFSTISVSNNGNLFKIGDNISTILSVVNRLKSETDINKALNRDIFYKEGVEAVEKCFNNYFEQRELELENKN